MLRDNDKVRYPNNRISAVCTVYQPKVWNLRGEPLQAVLSNMNDPGVDETVENQEVYSVR